MWLFTPRGFYSAVQHKQKPDMIVVRSRVRLDLERLLELVDDYLDHRPDILEWVGTDYRCRIYLPRRVWVQVLMDLGEELNYTNFKDAAHMAPDGPVTGRSQAYFEVWNTMNDFQRRNKSV